MKPKSGPASSAPVFLFRTCTCRWENEWFIAQSFIFPLEPSSQNPETRRERLLKMSVCSFRCSVFSNYTQQGTTSDFLPYFSLSGCTTVSAQPTAWKETPADWCQVFERKPLMLLQLFLMGIVWVSHQWGQWMKSWKKKKSWVWSQWLEKLQPAADGVEPSCSRMLCSDCYR